MVALASLCHVPLLYAVGSFGWDDGLVRVIGMAPGPNGELEAGDRELSVDLRLALPDGVHPNPMGAWLLRADADGERRLVTIATVDPDDPSVLHFRAPAALGRYDVWLRDSGPQPLVRGAAWLDGELTAGLPSGNGEPGGDFWASFTVVERQAPEHLVAHIVSEEPTVPTSEGEKEPEAIAPAPALALTPPPRARPRASVESAPTPTPPTSKPPPVIVDNELPLRRDPQAPKLTDVFDEEQHDVQNIVGEIADRRREELRRERARDGLLGGWEESLARTRGSLEGNGPKVNPGNQKLASTHTKEVWAYLALVHKRVHRQWADEYLINLDLVHRDPSSPLNNPQLETVLEIEIDGDGMITDVQVVQSSGVLMFDSEAIRVAWESSPGEPVPPEMLSDSGKAFVHWSFWRNQRQCGTFGAKVYVLADGKKRQVSVDLHKVEAEEERIGVRGQPHDHSSPFPGADEPPPRADPTAPKTRPAKPQGRKRKAEVSGD